MTFTVSSRVKIKGKKVVVQRTVDDGDHAAAISEVGEEVRRLRKANQAAIKSTRQSFRRKKAPKDA